MAALVTCLRYWHYFPGYGCQRLPSNSKLSVGTLHSSGVTGELLGLVSFRRQLQKPHAHLNTLTQRSLSGFYLLYEMVGDFGFEPEPTVLFPSHPKRELFFEPQHVVVRMGSRRINRWNFQHGAGFPTELDSASSSICWAVDDLSS